MERLVQPGQFYRHFKEKIYQIIAVAKHTETGETLVIYQAMYGDFGIYARPYEMFVSEVDHEKYPDVIQKYRFELIKSENIGNNGDKPVQQPENYDGVNPYLMAFLELDTLTEKLEMLRDLRKNIDDRLLDSIAASLDIVVEDGPLPQRYQEVLNCLETMEHFECSRFR